MKVLPCGTSVAVDDKYTGKILACCIRGRLVTYEVVWFVGDSRNSGWLQDFEFTVERGVRRMGL